jgi:protein-S-isoprenylcysteine O-methyltransferase Ste14
MTTRNSLGTDSVRDRFILPRKSGVERYRKAVNVGLYAMVFLVFLVNGPVNHRLFRFIELVGYLFLIVGIIGRIWCGIYIAGRKSKALSTGAGIDIAGRKSEELSTKAEVYAFGKKSKELCTDGPYSICRHPLYLSSFICGIGVASQADSVGVIMAFVIIFWCYYLQVIKAEEKGLRALFGEDYNVYCNRVPRIFPNVSNYQTRETVTVLIRHYTPLIWKSVWPILLALAINTMKLLMELLMFTLYPIYLSRMA